MQQEHEQPKKQLKKPNTYDDLYPGRFLKAGNFNGKKVTLTVSDYRREELEGEKGKEIKAIVSFKETEKELVACKTNGLCLRSMFGNLLPDWVGKKVILFPSTWAGKPAIRVWGSPDIAEEITVTVKLQKRKPFKLVMHTNANGDSAAAPGIVNDPDDDPGTHPDDEREPGSDG